ncbi:(Fe-S)-binding protein [Bacillus infantis]|uniref:(Fe-S)-binding protein n=1 Tax=Bacillus infantis TaxID=324767 RepID=UPI001CD5969B|nr:(Fe-S)-binding protein [Bacillus infantis]MCA1040505.1 (Fe-S)-binding protein [Bacillus infantis]
MAEQTNVLEKLAYAETFSCVQCGYCLPSCPTYTTMEKETHSPRGRINLVKMAAEGRISIEDMAGPMELCLGCRACEPACPTNVQYGRILESALDAVSEHRKGQEAFKEKALKKLVFDYIFPNRPMLKFIGSGLKIYQTLKADVLLREMKLLHLLPESMRDLEKVMPKAEGGRRRQNVLRYGEAKPKYRIGFFAGCVMDAVFSKVNDLSMKLLAAAGCEVVFIDEQTCCGALHQHSGEREKAVELAKRNIAAFEKYEVDYVINSIGGCGAALVEYHHLFEMGSSWHERAKAFSAKCKDISVLLDRLELPFQKEIRGKAVYQPSCHLKNVQRVASEPVSLIHKVPGVEYRPFPEMDMCCGSAGIYNIVHYGESMEILDRKMGNVQKAGPDLIISTNPGCHLQMLLGVEREGLQGQVRVLHLVELLAEACGIN